jgi:hypothetical protein
MRFTGQEKRMNSIITEGFYWADTQDTGTGEGFFIITFMCFSRDRRRLPDYAH